MTEGIYTRVWGCWAMYTCHIPGYGRHAGLCTPGYIPGYGRHARLCTPCIYPGMRGMLGYIPPYIHQGIHHPGYTSLYTPPWVHPVHTPLSVCVPRTALGVRSVWQRSPGLREGESHGYEAQRGLLGPKCVRYGGRWCAELLRLPRKIG